MRNLKEPTANAENIAREFRLSNQVAREIVAEETRKALNRSLWAWALLLCGISASGLIYFYNHENRTLAVFIILLTTVCWSFLGRYIARSAIRTAAHEKSERIHGSHT